MAQTALIPHPFGDAYAARARTPSAGPRLTALRTAARADVSRGLPGPKAEDWRFTPLHALARHAFTPAAAAAVEVDALPVDAPTVPGAVRVVLVNGVYRADLSEGVDAVAIKPLREADALVGTALPPALPLAALNTAYAEEGIVLALAGILSRPIHILSIGAGGDGPVAFHPRLLIATAPGAAATVVESHIALPGAPVFANAVAEIIVAEGATIRRYASLREDGESFHIATTGVSVAARGAFEAFHLGLGGSRSEGTARQEIHVALEGAGARVDLGGAYAIAGAMHHDFTTVVDHRHGGAISAQLFKGVLAGRSHGVYQGRVRVAPEAQKTDARQLHKALFLDAGAAVDVKPELEIAADDVQCAHGATTGSLDPDHLFYLAARGLDPATARMLLVEGFLTDALDRIGDETVRTLFARQVAAWLRAQERAS